MARRGTGVGGGGGPAERHGAPEQPAACCDAAREAQAKGREALFNLKSVTLWVALHLRYWRLGQKGTFIYLLLIYYLCILPCSGLRVTQTVASGRLSCETVRQAGLRALVPTHSY